MVARLLRSVRINKRSGHILVLAAVVSLLIVMVVGLTVDSGLMYGKRAQLSKAADAAAFAGLSNVSLGNTQATRIAEQVFRSNYVQTGTDYQPPTIDVEFITNSSNNRAIKIDAHAFAEPLFGRVLGLDHFNLSAHAEASRAKLVLSLALDRSGSMNANNGCAALPPATNAFVDFFEEGYDRMSLATYASDARVDVSMTTNFKAPVHAAVPSPCSAYFGYTFIDGGLTLAGIQNSMVLAGTGEDLVKVVVLFTDGNANTIQVGNFDCPPQMTFNLSGSDADFNPTHEVAILDPSNGNHLCPPALPGGSFTCCPNLLTFPSITGFGVQLDARNASLVRREAKARSLATAAALRQQGNFIYTIGLGQLGTDIDANFLREIANDPDGPNHNPDLPIGEFSHAQTAGDMEAVFIRLARLITLRLSA